MDRFIYALRDPETSRIRYVGLTTTGESRPIKQCRWPKLDASHRAAWTAKLKADGRQPEWFALEYCETDDQLSAAERFWIAYYRGRGFDLTNHMDGGFDGRPDDAARARMRSSHLKTHCKHGHEYTAENTGKQANGHRRCETCHAAWFAARPKYKTEHARARYLANPEPYKARSTARAKTHAALLAEQARARYTPEKRRAQHLRSKLKGLTQ